MKRKKSQTAPVIIFDGSGSFPINSGSGGKFKLRGHLIDAAEIDRREEEKAFERYLTRMG